MLVRVEAEPDVQTLDELMGTAPIHRRFLQLVVLDGSERLSLRRQQTEQPAQQSRFERLFGPALRQLRPR